MNRRSRRSNERRGSPPDITARDIAVFELLVAYRYLDSRQLYLLLPEEFQGDETFFKKRLRKLMDWGYIIRTLNHDETKLPQNMLYFGHEIYELGPGAIQCLLAERLYDDEESMTGLRAGKARELNHSLKICSVLASFELGARETPNVRFLRWKEILETRVPENVRLSKKPWLFPEVPIAYDFPTGRKTKKIRADPDSRIFGFEYAKPDGAKVYRFATLELENKNRVWCSHLEEASWLRKQLTFDQIRKQELYRTHFNLSTFFVYAIATSKAHTHSMMALTEKVSGKSKTTLFGNIPSYGHVYRSAPPLPELFTTPMQRVGYEPLNMAEVW